MIFVVPLLAVKIIIVMEKLIIPNTCINIKHRAIEDSYIKEVYISRSVKDIEPGAFLTSIIDKFIIEPENPYYETLANSNCIIMKHFSQLVATGRKFLIPSSVKQLGSLSIMINRKSTYQELRIPEGVERLCPLCISVSCYSNLELHLPSTIKRIDYQEWTDECDSIKKIVVPKGHKKRFSRMKYLKELKHIIVELGE